MKRLLPAVLLLALFAGFCVDRDGTGVPDETRQLVATFYEYVNAGRGEEFVRLYDPARKTMLTQNLKRRAGLGPQVTTQEMNAYGITGYSTGVTIEHNTAFEKGLALEQFSFKIDNGNMSLVTYNVHPGIQLGCPTIKLNFAQCWHDKVPMPNTSRASR